MLGVLRCCFLTEPRYAKNCCSNFGRCIKNTSAHHDQTMVLVGKEAEKDDDDATGEDAFNQKQSYIQHGWCQYPRRWSFNFAFLLPPPEQMLLRSKQEHQVTHTTTTK